jgi:hypothetical protein
MRIRLAVAALLGAFAMLSVASAEAQLNNKPFSFGTADGGIGMSTAARQAIINQQLFGVTPDHIMKGADGSLLTITRNGDSDHVPVVTTASGEIIPQFRGRGLDLGGLLLEGSGTGSGDGGQLLLGYGSSSGITVTSWTFRLVAATTGGGYPSFGGGYGFGGSGQSVNTWTAQVNGLAGI